MKKITGIDTEKGAKANRVNANFCQEKLLIRCAGNLVCSVSNPIFEQFCRILQVWLHIFGYFENCALFLLNFAHFKQICTICRILQGFALFCIFRTILQILTIVLPFAHLCAFFTNLHNFAHFALKRICSTSASSSFWSLFHPKYARFSCLNLKTGHLWTHQWAALPIPKR